MTKLTILRGISGSGKSTWAESQAGHPVIVSRDRIRMSLFGTENFIDEDLVTKVEHATIAAALKSGRDVISDNTNVRIRYIKPIANIGYKAGADVELKFFDVDLSTALTRNAIRAARGGRNVPESVIKKQYEGLKGTRNFTLEMPHLPTPYHGTPGAAPTFLVDIDGTLAHMRNHRGPYEWAAVGRDEVDEVVADIVATLEMSGFFTVVVMSGRDEVCRPETEAWLKEHGIDYDALFMRPEGDMRPDNIIKAELFDNHVRDFYDVKFVLDDRNQVVQMWRSMGLKCLQVAEGDF